MYIIIQVVFIVILVVDIILFDANIDVLFSVTVPVDRALLRNDIINPLSITLGKVIDIEDEPFDIK